MEVRIMEVRSMEVRSMEVRSMEVALYLKSYSSRGLSRLCGLVNLKNDFYSSNTYFAKKVFLWLIAFFLFVIRFFHARWTMFILQIFHSMI